MNLPSHRPQTVAQLVGHPARRHPERPALRFREGDGWTTRTWLDTAALVVAAAQWLQEQGRPPVVTIASPPSPAAVVLELGALVAGCSVNPLYHDAGAGEHRRVLETVRPDLVALGDGCQAVGTTALATALGAARPAPQVVSLDRLFGQWSRRAAALLGGATGGFEAQPLLDALALVSDTGECRRPASLLLQSSGTTGPARVIELDASAFLHAAWSVRTTVRHRHPRFLAFLPSGHTSHHLINVFTNTLLSGELCFGGPTVDTLVDDLRATRPTVLFGSPVLFTEIHHEVRDSLTASGSALGTRLWQRIEARRTAMVASGAIKPRPGTMLGRLVGRSVARKLGLDQTREFFSGTATLDADLHAFLAALGWYVRNTYGVSEMAGAGAISGPGGMVPGELGEAVDGVGLRVDGDGQIHLAGPTAGRRYLGGPNLVVDDWLATGDLAVPAGEGRLLPGGRRSSQITVGDVTTSLDAVESASASILPRFQPVVHQADDGTLRLFLFPRPNGAGAVAVEGEAAAELLGLIDEVAVLDEPIGAADGDLGPTGKVRRWRVALNWQHRLHPARPEGMAGQVIDLRTAAEVA